MGRLQSIIIGLLGLIPFIFLAAACFIIPPDKEVYELLIFIYISYAAVISSFLGGIQWGLITASAERVYFVFLPLLISTVPCLISWSALLTIKDLRISLILIIASFAVSILHDYYLDRHKLTPHWFLLSIRIPLSLTVIILTSILFFL